MDRDLSPGPARAGYALVLGALVVLLALQMTVPGRGGDPAAAYRLVAYPAVGLALPVGWWARSAARPGSPPVPSPPVPWGPSTLLALPLLLDTIGNLSGLYGRVAWWDDMSHLVHWLLIGTAAGLLLSPTLRPRWAVVPAVTGVGAVLAIIWELFERWAFYGSQVAGTVYTDTLTDLALGTTGALLGALVANVATRSGRRTLDGDPPPH